MALDPSERFFRDSVESLYFRSNPLYKLIKRDYLSPEQIVACGEIYKDEEFYGILAPAINSNLSYKSLFEGDALLFLQLQTPGPIPALFFEADTNFHTYIAQLLFDRVIEVQLDGQFVSGKSAVNSSDTDFMGVTISDRALIHGAAFASMDAQALTGRLYFYNRLPVGLGDCKKFSKRSLVKTFLGMDGQISSQFALDESEPKSDSFAWITWKVRHKRELRSKTPHKLYVCVYPEALPKVFRTCVAVLAENGANSFKVGADSFALNRPDKFVAYFDDQKSLLDCAELLSPLLEGLRVHQLPFTGELSTPALAWGVDPPNPKTITHWSQVESWRVWLCKIMASAIVSAKNDGATIKEAVQFAKHRISLEGVDLKSWTPTSEIRF
jgi:hypothetical protein